jgi:hypothetical protein
MLLLSPLAEYLRILGRYYPSRGPCRHANGAWRNLCSVLFETRRPRKMSAGFLALAEKELCSNHRFLIPRSSPTDLTLREFPRERRHPFDQQLSLCGRQWTKLFRNKRSLIVQPC